MTAKIHDIFTLLNVLDEHNVSYVIFRGFESIIVLVTIVGKRLEIQCNSDGTFDTSVFVGDESVTIGEEIILELLKDGLN